MAQSTFCFRPDESGILEDVSNEVRKKARRGPKDVSPPRVKTKKKTCLRCYLFKEKVRTQCLNQVQNSPLISKV